MVLIHKIRFLLLETVRTCTILSLWGWSLCVCTDTCVCGCSCMCVFERHVGGWGVEWRRETSDLHPAAQCMCFLFVYKGFQLGSDWKIILLAWTFFLVVSSILSDCWIPVLEWISPFPLAFRLLNRCVYIYIYAFCSCQQGHWFHHCTSSISVMQVGSTLQMCPLSTLT